MKQRMSSVDVAAECACLNARLLGLRVANVYDLNAKTYVIKLAKSGEDGEKVLLLLESGSRFHTIEAMPGKNDVPTNFTLKLRKHLRTRRLEAVRQLGVDRIVDFVFGSGEAQYHLILEMYSQGNVVLADSKFEVLTLLRSHRDDEKGFAVMARHPYPMQAVRLRHEVTEEELSEALSKGAEESLTLKATISSLLPYGPAVAEHVVLDAGLDPSDKQDIVTSHPVLLAALRRLDAWFAALDTSAPPGYITAMAPGGGGRGTNQKKKGQQLQQQLEGGEGGAATPATPAAPLPEVYEDFNPLKPFPASQGGKGGGGAVHEFKTFDASLSEFFSKIEGQRAAVARTEAERNAMSKLDKIRHDQSGRVSALQRDADEAELRGTLVEYNLEAVDAAINAVNEALASGMSWRDLDQMIREERKAGNPVACLIHSLQLEENKTTLLLSNYLDGDEDEEEAMTRPASKVQVDLSLTAYSNARVHYESRKKHASKQVKTLAANEQAIKAAEAKAQQQLLKVRSQPVAAAIVPRKPFWFERFNWFISSENFLVISGRDAQQNELIVKRYFRKGDVYVHAELHGASSTIIKNPDPEKPVPPTTLQQAGCACVCRSRAWDSKIVTSAWYVYHHQVSKTAPTGEYLPTGSFMIRGRKNFLPPQPLVFGFGYMFKLEEGSVAGHLGERAPKVSLMDEEARMARDDEEGEEDEEEEGEVSALDRFLEGGADPLAGGAPSSTSRKYSISSTTAATPAAGKAGRSSSGRPPGEGGASKGPTAAADKYGLHDTSSGKGGREAGEDEEEDAEPGGRGQQQQQSRPGAGKKGAANGGDHQRPAAAGWGATTSGGKKATGAVPAAMASAPAGARGKKGKLKTMKDRYADQDEEDREMALQLLASQGDKKTRSDRRKERKDRKEDKRKGGQVAVPGGLDADEMAEAVAKATTKQFKSQAVQDQEEAEEDEDDGASTPSDIPSSEGEEENKGGVHPRKAKPASAEASVASARLAGGAEKGEEAASSEGVVQPPMDAAAPDAEGDGAPSAALREAERVEIAALLAEEGGGAGVTAEDRERLTALDALTGLPRSEDLLLAALPVCGPYQALQNYKYKVKLTPGSVKKGKAARQALELLIRGSEVTPRERDLLKTCPEMDMITAILGGCKLSMPGLQKLKATEKQGKKAKAKAAKAQALGAED